jgi:putative salt-induced outer membrane protein YdiY
MNRSNRISAAILLAGLASLPALAQEAAPAALPPETAPAEANPWKFKLSAAFAGSDNDNTSNWNLRFAGEAKQATETNVTTLGAEYFFQTSDGDDTDNNLKLRGLEEWLFKDSKWELFAEAIYQNDEFADWEQRIGLYAGPAYRLVEKEAYKLKVRAGAGASYEFPTSDWTPELLVGESLEWKINDRSKLVHALDVFPDLDETSEYRLVVSAEYQVDLDSTKSLVGNLGVRNEYDSYIESTGDSSNDFKIYAGISAEF